MPLWRVAIREWAQAHGMEVSARGRIASSVLEAYRDRDAQHAAEAATEEPPAAPKKPRRRTKAKAAAE